jgi:hypothetical protein
MPFPPLKKNLRKYRIEIPFTVPLKRMPTNNYLESSIFSMAFPSLALDMVKVQYYVKLRIRPSTRTAISMLFV